MSNVAVVFWAALVPLALNATVAPAGTLKALQAYERFAWPRLSAPSTLKFVVVPVTVDGLAAAAVATVGDWSVVPVKLALANVAVAAWLLLCELVIMPT